MAEVKDQLPHRHCFHRGFLKAGFPKWRPAAAAAAASPDPDRHAQVLRPHPSPAESETLEVGPAVWISVCPHVVLMQLKLANQCLGAKKRLYKTRYRGPRLRWPV